MSEQAEVVVKGWLCIEAHGKYFSNQDRGNAWQSLKCVHACLQA